MCRAQALRDPEHEVTIGAVPVGIAPVAFTFVVRVDRAVSVDALNSAVVLKLGAAVRAALLQTAPCLRADTNAVSDFDVLDFRANADSSSDDLVADDTG